MSDSKDKDRAGILMRDFNSEFRKYITQRKLTKPELANKIRRLKKQIEENKAEIKRLGYQKSKITQLVKHGKINYLLADKQYKMFSASQHIKKIQIKEKQEEIKNLQNNQEVKIEILGIFSRTFVKKSYFLNLKNQAEYMLRIDLKEAKKIVSAQSYKIQYGVKQKYGIESQLKRLQCNLNEILGYDEEDVECGKDYPIEVIITPTKIMFL